MPDATATWGQPESSLPFYSKKDTLKRYRMRVEGVLSWRQQEGFDDTWERLRDLYRLRAFDAFSEEDRVLVAVAFATINVIEPSVAINHPKIAITATNEDEWAQAQIAEAVVNYWWRHHKIQKTIRRAVKDFLIYGIGWVKVGYRYTERERPLDEQQLADLHAELALQADSYAETNPDLAGELPSDEEIAYNLPTHETVVAEDRPFVERVSPFDVFVDPEATSMDDCRWICQRIVRPIDEVKNDPRFKSSVRRKLESDGSVVWQNSKSKHYVDAEAGRITLWEFYDIVRRTMSVFVLDGGLDFLVDPEPFPYPYGVPLQPIMDYEVPDQFYPIGELEAIEPLQQELSETRSAMVRARKESLRKYVYHADAFGPEGVAALRSDRDNTAIPVNENVPLDQAIKPLETIPTNVELYRHSDVILTDMDRVSGLTEYQRGQAPEIRRTATEASMIQDAANARAADKLAEVENFVSEVARYVLMLAQEYMTGEQTARKTGVDGSSVWFKYAREDIAGEFDFEVEAGSMQPKNDTFRRQTAMQLLQTIGPIADAGVVDMRVLAEHVLRDAFGIKNAQKFIVPPPDPNVQAPPDEKLIQTIDYKDAPPDIQRQMEQEAGFQPSIYGALPHDGGGPASPSGPTEPGGGQESQPKPSGEKSGP